MNFQEVVQQITPAEEISMSNDFLAPLPAAVNRDTWLVLAKRVVLVVNYGAYHQAALLLKQITNALAESEDATRYAYEPILVWLSYAALDTFTDSEVESFFRQRDIGLLLKEPIFFDVINKTKLWLLTKPIAERDVSRELAYNALRQNGQVLTRSFVKNNERGTVLNWIKAYDVSVGLGIADALPRAEFENNASIAARLNELEKNAVRQLFDFYEFIKLSTLSIEGYENDFVASTNGRTYLYTKGKGILATPVYETKYAHNSVTASKETQVAALPAVQDIAKRAQVYLASANGQTNTVVSELQKSVESAQILGATASLLLLAQLRQLDNLMEDPRFSKLVGDDLRKAHQDDMISGMAANPGAPQYIARLLKVILEDKLNLSREDALAFGSRLSKILAMEGEKYQTIIKNNKWNL